MSQERTEKPTPKRLREAREKGQVARSRDLALAAASVAATVALAKLGSRLLTGLAEHLASDLAHFGDAPLKAISEGDINSRVIQGAGLLALLVGPIAMATMAVGVAMHGFQGGWNFAPRGWALCNGQILSIAQNTALFSLLGTTYGGNGQTTFALPNLQGRVPMH